MGARARVPAPALDFLRVPARGGAVGRGTVARWRSGPRHAATQHPQLGAPHDIIVQVRALGGAGGSAPRGGLSTRGRRGAIGAPPLTLPLPRRAPRPGRKDHLGALCHAKSHGVVAHGQSLVEEEGGPAVASHGPRPVSSAGPLRPSTGPATATLAAAMHHPRGGTGCEALEVQRLRGEVRRLQEQLVSGCVAAPPTCTLSRGAQRLAHTPLSLSRPQNARARPLHGRRAVPRPALLAGPVRRGWARPCRLPALSRPAYVPAARAVRAGGGAGEGSVGGGGGVSGAALRGGGGTTADPR